MIQAHSLSWTQAQAASRVVSYRRLLLISIVLEALLGLLAIIAPVVLARLLGQPEPFPDSWLRAWGLLLIGTSVLYLSGWVNPTFYRWPNWTGIGLRLAMAILFLVQGQAFLLLAVWEGIWAVVLFVTYYRLARADTAWRP
jgi:hypothetical protein